MVPTLCAGRSGQPQWAGKVRTDWREDSQAKMLGQDVVSNRGQWGRAELDFMANIYSVLII